LSYSSYNNLNYFKFLMALDVISPETARRDAQWTLGLIGQPLLSAFAGEKYALTTRPEPFQEAKHYEFLKRYGDIYAFRNNAFLPLGLIFEHYIREDVFLQMPTWAKRLALIHTVTIADNQQKDGLSALSLDELKQRIRAISLPDVFVSGRATALNMRSFSETTIDGSVRLDSDGLLLFQMPFDPGWHAFVDQRSAPVVKADVGLLGVVIKRGEHVVKLVYRPPFLFSGAVVTILSCIIFWWSLWRWPNIHLPADNSLRRLK
jgi:uncharacterized membrane protein YfhO